MKQNKERVDVFRKKRRILQNQQKPDVHGDPERDDAALLPYYLTNKDFC